MASHCLPSISMWYCFACSCKDWDSRQMGKFSSSFSISLLMFMQHIDFHAINCVYSMYNCMSALFCILADIMILLPFSTTPSMNTNSLQNGQSGCISGWASGLIDGQLLTIYDVSAHRCSSVCVVCLIFCIVLHSEMSVIWYHFDLLGKAVMVKLSRPWSIPNVSSLSFCIWFLH